jgi:chromosome segregation ATPase
MTLTEEIYAELKNGLWTGLNYDGLRSKYEKSKGPFYNALQMVLAETAAEMTKLSSELKALREKGDEEKAKLSSLADQQKKAVDEIKARQQEIEALEGEAQAIKTKIQELNAELDASAGLQNRARELEKMGFDSEKLQRLRDIIVEIGTKQGLKPDEAIGRFFSDLRDYDTKAGFEREIQRLGTITETKKLEAENWQAKAERLESQYRNLKEAIDAMQALLKRGVKAEQIVSWNGIVSKLGGPEELQDNLGQYKSMSELVNARKEEVESYELRLTKAQSQLETLEKERAKIEGAIETLREAGLKEVKATTEAIEKQLKALVTKEIGEIQAVGREVRGQFNSRFAQYDELLEGISQASQKLERLKQELQKYEALKETLQAHAVASEAIK